MFACRISSYALAALWLAGLASVSNFPTTSAIFNSSENNHLDCYEMEIGTLSDECRPIKIYNEREWSRMSTEEALELAKRCSCELVNLDWEAAYDDHPSTRRVDAMVRGVLKMDKYKHTYPPLLWSDIDVVANGYSIFLSTLDYFQKVARDPSWAHFTKAELEREAHLRDLRRVCAKVAMDKLYFYQYLENLQRINPVFFFSLLEMNAQIDLIYQASKACKLLLLHRLHDFKLKPTNRGFNIAGQTKLRPSDVEDFNEITSNNNLDEALRDASVSLVRCRHWQTPGLTLKQFERVCPIVMSEELPSEWVQRHPKPNDRSQVALKCGCQLLMLNGTWHEIASDKNITIMSETLTGYMDLHPLPKMHDRFSTNFDYYEWFHSAMDKFMANKRIIIKEVVKYLRGDQDPTNEINQLTGDEQRANDLVMAACVRLAYSHSQGTFLEDEAKPITYLDNLRYISQDPLFVFHLTVQDKNLFRLYAVSKICQPVLR